MRYIQCTLKNTGENIYINANKIEAITNSKDGDTMINMVGDTESYYIVNEGIISVLFSAGAEVLKARRKEQKDADND